MKLIINRSQADKKGLFGGHQGVEFTLHYRLELTPDEQELVDRYQLQFYPLTWTTTHTGERKPDDTITNMVQGRTQAVTDVTTLLKNEETVKRACDNLPPLFRVVRSFGGDEVIEYPRDEARG